MGIYSERLRHCTYLQFDDAHILFDCGVSSEGATQDDAASEVRRSEEEAAYIARLEELAPHLTLIVLSHPTLASLGLYPFLATHLKLSPACVVYASPPTVALGRLAIQEWTAQRTLEEDDGLASSNLIVRTPEEEEAAQRPAPWKVSRHQVIQAFDRITSLRFNSPSLLAGRNAPLTLLASRAGHTIGGTLWTLRSPTSDDVVYAPVWNHLKEKTIDGAVAITAAAGAANRTRKRGIVMVGADRSRVISPKLKTRNAALLELVTATLSQTRSVLIPCDASARVIELLVLLSQHWAFSKLPYPLCMVSHTAKALPLAMSNQHDFFGTNVAGAAQSQASLSLSNVQRFDSLEELNASVPSSQPRLILAAPACLTYGFSRTAFADFAQQSGNVVLLTQRGEPGSLSEWLFEKWEVAQHQRGTTYGNEGGRVGTAAPLSGTLSLQMKRRENLKGAELKAFNEAIEAETDRLAKEKEVAARRQRIREARDAAESDSSSDEEEITTIKSGAAIETQAPVHPMQDVTNAAPLPMDTTRRYGDFSDVDASGTTGGFDMYVRRAPTRRFPFVERRARVDAYGEQIDVSGWLARGKIVEQRADTAALLALGKRKREEEEEAAKAAAARPHRFVTETRKISLRCSVFVLDAEGRADGRALKALIPLMNPRKLVLLGHDAEAMDDFKSACLSNASMTRDIISAPIGERVQVGEDVPSYTVRLDDSLLGTVGLRKVGDYEVGRVYGSVAYPEEASIPSLFSTAAALDENSSAPVLPSLAKPFLLDAPTDAMDEDEPVDTTDDNAALPALPPALFIGDVKLATLRQALKVAAIPAAYAGEGVLLCGPLEKVAPSTTTASARPRDPRLAKLGKAKQQEATPDLEDDPHAAMLDGRVVVRKEGDGRLTIEGPPGETFFAVRDAVYALHAANA